MHREAKGFVEGAYDVAEQYLLSAGSRDSARLLAEAFLKWGTPSSTFGLFALRGVIPYAIFFGPVFLLTKDRQIPRKR